MIAQVQNIDDHGVRYSVLAFVCPGCATYGSSGLHMLPVNTDLKSPAWTWDGNLEAPTLSPSILTHTEPYVDGKGTGICHSFISAGIVEFLGDCTHSLAGQKVPLPELPDWFVNP